MHSTPPAPSVPSPGPKLVDERLRSYTEEQLRGMYRTDGMILRADDGARVIGIGYGKWRFESPGTYGTDANTTTVDRAWVAEHGPWRVEAHAPGTRPLEEVVYLDIDGTGRKVYVASPMKHDIAEYEKAARAWEKAGKPTGGAPRRPTLLYIEHRGMLYAVAPTAWYGVTDAASWYVVGEPRPTRRAEAAKAADRRVLSPGASQALDAVVLHVLPDVDRSYRTYSLTVGDLWRDLTENRENVFAILHDREGYESYPWKVSFAPQGDDDKLLADAAYSSKLGERLISASLRRLVAAGWAQEHHREDRRLGSVKGYARGPRALSRQVVEAATGWQSPVKKADDAADTAEKRLRGRSSSSYSYISTPEYRALSAARDAVREARAAVAHPFAAEAALGKLADAVAHLNEAAGNIP